MCRKLLKNLFKRSKEQKPIPQPAPEQKPLRWQEFPSKLISTSRGGFNMPKYQPCPRCRARAKRQYKTEIGALYSCRCGRSFAVSR